MFADLTCGLEMTLISSLKVDFSEEELGIDYFGRILAVHVSIIACVQKEDAAFLGIFDLLMPWWYDFNDSLYVRAVSSSYPVSEKAI